ncbi:MAG TPA: hypothetical protein DEP84_19180 [Chloroflexi bacterium]|nr:hypothetical protein [Chloroflexota bacterium]
MLAYAARMTEKALLSAFASIAPGHTEKTMANRLAAGLLDCGADSINFLYINAGANTGFPHCKATQSRSKLGDIVKCDVGAYFQGYTSDVARTSVIGTPTSEQRSISTRLMEVHTATITAARPVRSHPKSSVSPEKHTTRHSCPFPFRMRAIASASPATNGPCSVPATTSSSCPTFCSTSSHACAGRGRRDITWRTWSMSPILARVS